MVLGWIACRGFPFSWAFVLLAAIALASAALVLLIKPRKELPA